MARGGLPGDQLGVRHPRKKEQNVKKNCRTRSVESHERSMTKVGPRVSDPKKKKVGQTTNMMIVRNPL